MESKRCTHHKCLDKNVSQPLSNFKQTGYGYDFYCISCRKGDFELTEKICKNVGCYKSGQKQPVKDFYIIGKKTDRDKYDYYCRPCRRQSKNSKKLEQQLA